MPAPTVLIVGNLVSYKKGDNDDKIWMRTLLKADIREQQPSDISGLGGMDFHRGLERHKRTVLRLLVQEIRGAGMKTLFVTEVGSRMWRMERPDSDSDLFKAYIAPTYDILSGISHQNSHFSQADEVDTASHEIGVVINQLLKGNVNFIWGVHSPIVLEDRNGGLSELRELSAVPSSNCYYSIRGLAYHNYSKYIIDRKEPVEVWQKRINIICRTLQFGIRILRAHEYRFEPFRDGTPDRIVELLGALEAAKAETTLAPTPVWEEEVRKWLFRERMVELGGRCV